MRQPQRIATQLRLAGFKSLLHLLLTSFVTLGKFLNFSVQHVTSWMRIIAARTSEPPRED